MKQYSEILKKNNLKVTPQRLAIYDLLYHTDKHPSAETIYRALEDSFPSMSLATVYKTLDTFKNANIIQELSFGEDSFRYDAKCESHPHFICTHCREVYDLPPIKGLQALKDDLSSQTNFTFSGEQLNFYGVCPNCKKGH